MKKRIIKWLLGKLDPDGHFTEEQLLVKLKVILDTMSPSYFSSAEFEKDIYKTLFNSYYRDFTDDPFGDLERFKAKADKGDNTFKSDPFFRILRQRNDKQVRNLNYRLKRNET